MILPSEDKDNQQARTVGQSSIPQETIPLSSTSDLDDLDNVFYAKQDGETDEEGFDKLEKFLDGLDTERARPPKFGVGRGN